MSEKFLDAIPEESQEEASVRPTPRPAGLTARRFGNCLLVAVMAVALVCAISVIVALVLWPLDNSTGEPTATPQPPPIVTPLQIREIAKMESAEYYLVAEIPHTRVPDSWIDKLGVKEEIFILEYGTVIGGFDLTNLADDAIWQDGWRVMLKLPSPEVLRVEIDFDKSHVVYRKGWCPDAICGDDLDNFIQEIEPQAVEQLKEQAVEYGLLEKTAVSGRDYFYYLLKSLGFTEVRVVVDGYIYE